MKRFIEQMPRCIVLSTSSRSSDLNGFTARGLHPFNALIPRKNHPFKLKVPTTVIASRAYRNPLP